MSLWREVNLKSKSERRSVRVLCTYMSQGYSDPGLLQWEWAQGGCKVLWRGKQNLRVKSTQKESNPFVSLCHNLFYQS